MKKFLALTLIFLMGCSNISFADCALSTLAETQIGHGEEDEDNYGEDVAKYLGSPDLQGSSWCAAFVSWCLKNTGYVAPYYLSARSFWNSEYFIKTENPECGDIIVLWRGSKNSNLGHVGIVEKVEGNKITTIQGNVGAFPSKVKRVVYKDKNKIKQLLGYVKPILVKVEVIK